MEDDEGVFCPLWAKKEDTAPQAFLHSGPRGDVRETTTGGMNKNGGGNFLEGHDIAIEGRENLRKSLIQSN